MYRGRLIKGIGGFYYVDIGGEIFECKPRGLFRKKKISPVVGDHVRISILDHDNKIGVIEEIDHRQNELIRPAVCNVDQVILIFSVAQPEPHLSLIDRFLVLGESQKLNIVICFNKVDLLEEEAYEELINIYKSIGYDLVLSSSKLNKGIGSLKEKLKNKTSVFAGPSGVGKSTLLNCIYPELGLETGRVSKKTGRGRHTTRHAELIGLGDNSWVVDTPGFSSLSIDFIGEEDLAYYFPEFISHMATCQFNSCIHINEPRCGVKEAVQLGKISQKRYNSYIQFIDEIRRNRRY